jgi:hypothetical protein
VTKGLKKLSAKLRGAREAHAARHTKSGYQFCIADSIHFLPSAWDEVAAHGSFFLSRAYLAALEAHPPSTVTPRYALIFAAGKPVCAMAAQLLDISGSQFVKATKAKSKRAAAAGKLRERMLVCGNVLSWGFHGLAFAPDADEASIYGAVAEAIYRLRRAERLGGQVDYAMIKDLTPPRQGPAGALARYSYEAHETEPNMVLQLSPDWRTFDDYLASMNSKYRGATRKIVRSVEEAGFSVERVAIEPWAERVHDLYLAVHGKATVRLATAAPGYLPALARAAGAGFRLTAIHKDGQLAGFVTSVVDGDTTVGYYIGFDYELNESTPLYFRLLLATVEDAIHFRSKRLSLGRTALEPKAKLGATPEPMTVWVRHRVPLVNAVVRRVLRGLQHAEAPERSPFK